MSRSNLFILAVDQRPWLTHALYGHTGVADAAQRAAICRGKHMVLDGLLAADEDAVDRTAAAILVDDVLGPGVPERARAHGITLSMPVESAGQELYEDHFEDVAGHLRHHEPELAKVLVRYNPEGDSAANAIQRQRLQATATAAREAGSRFLFELLVPPTAEQLATAGGTQAFQSGQRPELILRAMQDLSSVLDVDVWKLEHLGAQANYADAVALAARSGGECILLGAGAAADQVDEWLSMAARSGFTGFAIGRSIWWQALRDLLAGEITHDAAVSIVASCYSRFVTTFRNASTDRDPASVTGVS